MLRGSTGRPHLNGALLGKKQPPQSGAIALIVSHFLAQGGQTPGPFIARAGQFHHQIRAEGSKTSSLLQTECLPMIKPHRRGIKTDLRNVSELKAKISKAFHWAMPMAYTLEKRKARPFGLRFHHLLAS